MRKRIDTKGNIMMEREAHDDMIATLEQENRQLHARNQRLQAELYIAYEKCAQIADSYRSIEGRGIAEQIRGIRDAG